MISGPSYPTTSVGCGNLHKLVPGNAPSKSSPSRTMPPKPAAGLPTEVVNDKGRYHSLKSTARGRSCGSRLLAFVATLPLEGEDAPNFPEADLWPGITSGLPFAQNPKVMPDIESKLNLLMVSFARRGVTRRSSSTALSRATNLSFFGSASSWHCGRLVTAKRLPSGSRLKFRAG